MLFIYSVKSDSQTHLDKQVCTLEGLQSSTEVIGLQLESLYAFPKQYVTILGKAFSRAVNSGVCHQYNLNSTLTYLNHTAWDNSTSRFIDIYYSAWSDTYTVRGFNATTQLANLVPRLDKIDEFCAAYHPTCPEGGIADPTCPGYCTTNHALYLNSMRNAELCFFSTVMDLMVIFMNEGLVRSVWLESTLGSGIYLPVRQDIYDITANINEWDNEYSYGNDLEHNPTKSFIWSAPYVDPFFAGNLVSGTMPIYFQDFFFAIFGVDMLIGSNLLQDMNGTIATPSAFSMLVTEIGAVISATEFGWTSLFGPDVDKIDVNNNIFNTSFGDFSSVGADFASINDIVVRTYRIPLNGNKPYRVTCRKITAISWFLILVAPEDELLYASKIELVSQESQSVTLFTDEAFEFNFTLANKGSLGLMNEFSMNLPEGNWAVFGATGETDHSLSIAPMTNASILVRVQPQNLTRGEYFTLISISTKDELYGWCYTRLINIKLSLSLHSRVDTYIYPVASSPSGVFFSILAVVLIATSIALAVVMWIYREEDVIRASSVNFCLIIIFGSILVYSSLFFWEVEPTSRVCMGRAWFGFLGFSLVLGCLTAKNYRIWKIFKNSKLRKIRLSDQQLLFVVLGLLSFDVIILVIWEIVDPMVPYLYTSTLLEENEAFYDCNSDHLSIWVTILFAEKLALVLLGCLLAFKTRSKVLDKYNESKIIGFSMYNILIIATLCILLVTMLDSAVQVTFSFVSIGILIPVGSTMLALFLPKLLTLAGFLKALTMQESSDKQRSHHSHSQDGLPPNTPRNSISMSPAKHSVSKSSTENEKV